MAGGDDAAGAGTGDTDGIGAGPTEPGELGRAGAPPATLAVAVTVW